MWFGPHAVDRSRGCWGVGWRTHSSATPLPQPLLPTALPCDGRGGLSKALRFIDSSFSARRAAEWEQILVPSISLSLSLRLWVIRSSTFVSFSGGRCFLYSLSLHCAWNGAGGSRQPRMLATPQQGHLTYVPWEPLSSQLSIFSSAFQPPDFISSFSSCPECGSFEVSTVWPIFHPIGLLSSTSQAESYGPHEHMESPHLDCIPFYAPAWPLVW